MQIVKFKNGKYAVRKGFLLYQFRDLKDNMWWPNRFPYQHYFQGTLEQCQEVLSKEQNRKDKELDNGTPI